MMRWVSALSPNTLGGLCALISVIFFSANDVIVKFLSGDYALHQLILIRSVLGLIVIATVIAPLTQGWRVFRTKLLHLHLIRGSFVVLANMAFFLGLAAMPLADAVAIFFISPVVITVFSVVFLREHVGPRRWAAVVVGLIGVIIIVRPGTSAFQTAAFLPLLAAVAYASLHMMTRRIGGTESAATMAIYIQITFIIVSGAIGLAIGDGRFAGHPDPSLAFFFRAWDWPAASDWPPLLMLGLGIAIAGFLISQAYRVAEAAYVAPFEYIAMPLAILWGVFIFDEIPDMMTLLGSALIIGAGLFMLWRENSKDAVAAVPRTRR